VAGVLDVELPVRTVFDHPTLAGQAQALEDAVRARHGEERLRELLRESSSMAADRLPLPLQDRAEDSDG
jgi:hypothetical protein